MEYLTFTKLRQTHKVGGNGIKASLKWVGSEQDAAIVSFTCNLGMSCFLHLGPSTEGSVFEFHRENHLLTLIADYVLTEGRRVKQLNVILEHMVVQADKNPG